MRTLFPPEFRKILEVLDIIWLVETDPNRNVIILRIPGMLQSRGGRGGGILRICYNIEGGGLIMHRWFLFITTNSTIGWRVVGLLNLHRDKKL